MTIKALIFDLGNVVIDIDFERIFKCISIRFYFA